MTTQETVTFDAISYALAKQVPSMERGFTISTSYGDIVFEPDEAPQVVAVVRHLLEAKLSGSSTPAAQSAGQEPLIVLRKDADGLDLLNLPAAFSKLPDGEYPLYTAPVNGGNLPPLPDDFSESKDWRESDYAGRVEWLLERVKDLRDAPVNGGERELTEDERVALDFYQNNPSAALLDFRRRVAHNAADAPEVEVPGEKEYWAKYDGDAALSSPAKVGGDEREAFEMAYEKIFPERRKLIWDLMRREGDGYQHPNVDGYWKLWRLARAALSADAGDRKDAERRSIEGIAVFMRGAPSEQACMCCPPGGGHIFARRVNWDEWYTNRPAHFGNDANALVSNVLDNNATEGKRIRVTVEVLDAAIAAQANGDAS